MNFYNKHPEKRQQNLDQLNAILRAKRAKAKALKQRNKADGRSKAGKLI